MPKRMVTPTRSTRRRDRSCRCTGQRTWKHSTPTWVVGSPHRCFGPHRETDRLRQPVEACVQLLAVDKSVYSCQNNDVTTRNQQRLFGLCVLPYHLVNACNSRLKETTNHDEGDAWRRRWLRMVMGGGGGAVEAVHGSAVPCNGRTG